MPPMSLRSSIADRQPQGSVIVTKIIGTDLRQRRPGCYDFVDLLMELGWRVAVKVAFCCSSSAFHDMFHETTPMQEHGKEADPV